MPSNRRPLGTPLNPRQQRLLALAANGHTIDAMATREGIARTNVCRNLATIQEQLGARSRTHAVALALVRGILRPSDIEPPRRTTPDRNGHPEHGQ